MTNPCKLWRNMISNCKDLTDPLSFNLPVLLEGEWTDFWNEITKSTRVSWSRVLMYNKSTRMTNMWVVRTGRSVLQHLAQFQLSIFLSPISLIACGTFASSLSSWYTHKILKTFLRVSPPSPCVLSNGCCYDLYWGPVAVLKLFISRSIPCRFFAVLVWQFMIDGALHHIPLLHVGFVLTIQSKWPKQVILRFRKRILKRLKYRVKYMLEFGGARRTLVDFSSSKAIS